MDKFRKTSFQIILAVIIISSIIFVIPNIPNSYAHAFVTKSDPAPSQSLATQPSKVDVYFSDPIDIRYSQVKVLDSDARDVQEKDQHYINNDQSALSVSLPAGLKNGIYTVTTKVLDQTDGHVTENAFVFAIGQAVPQNLSSPSTASNYEEISVPEAIARFPALVGQVMVVGVSFATLWLWRPISRISWLENALAETRIKIDQSMMKLAVIGSIILVSSDFVMIAVQAFSINAGILDAINTKFGSIWMIRMIVSSVLLALSFTMYYKIKKSNAVCPKSHALTLFGIGLIVLTTTSLISHGAATGKILPLIVDFIHNMAASFWIGGIIYIAFVLMPKLRQLSRDVVSASTISIIIPRFTIIAITILGFIVITGPILLYTLENNLALTLASTYGKILIIKLSLAAVLIAIGGYHEIATRRRAITAVSILTLEKNKNVSQNIDIKSILSTFNRNIRIEAIVGIALIASIAILVDSGLPASEFQNQLQSMQEQNVFALTTDNAVMNNGLTETKFVENGSRVVLTINPFATGNNDFKISFLDSNKNPVDMKSVQLRLTQIDQGIGPIIINAQQVSTGIFSASTAFGFSGHWNVRIEGIQNKENSLNLVASYDDLLVKPKLASLIADIKEFKTPETNSRPLYPVYDKSRNSVWMGDNNSKIFEFDLNSRKFIEHKIDGVNITSAIALDSQNKIWYTDPLSKIIGNYDPNNNSNQIYKIPSQGTISGITIDDSDNVWLIDATSDKVLKFNPIIKNFTSINLESGSQPLGIAVDKSSGQIWIAEGGIGKIASIDPNNYKINEYAPTEKNVTLATPTGIISDPLTGNIYVSEHDGQAVSVFNPLLKTFKKITLDSDSHDLPLGMIFDNYHNLWIAQHTLDKIAVMDPRTGEFREFDIPTKNTWVQWLTIDSQGDIIMAEDMSGSLGIISTNVNPALTQDNSQTNNLSSGIPSLGFSYADMVAPSMSGLLIIVAFFYSKSTTDLKSSIRQVMKNTN